ncbi:hypothetical protein C9374_000907 [Naegleria lovaniensis]|uniref:Peptidase S1 domain-containing protein n=1 Tax=Naegleria lovaniensis TaxID=51637 RepID=A0AA88GSG8_NAELO|nr:uncharacterized protein C9374_000907 [Naegleria lovaniensis]KAG2388057.1 hypothetical protein C9374_000907 [Naegleria lovaniensis]
MKSTLIRVSSVIVLMMVLMTCLLMSSSSHIFVSGNSKELHMIQPLTPTNSESADLPSKLIQLRKTRVSGGTKASTNEFPFIVSIQYLTSSSSAEHFCGGSIIAPNFILTAAHCFYDDAGRLISASNIVVVHGRTNVACSPLSSCSYVQAKTYTIHPSYSTSTIRNDIALIELVSNIAIDGTKTRVAYIESGSVPLSYYVFVSGWGYYDSSGTISTSLLKARVPIVSVSKCNDLGLQTTSPMQICAGLGQGVDACSGDSGGPIFRYYSGSNYTTNDYVVTGIVSYGPDISCGSQGSLGVYSNTTYFLKTFLQSRVPSIQLSAFDASRDYQKANDATSIFNRKMSLLSSCAYLSTTIVISVWLFIISM